jgi:hypothetical protein
VVFDPTPERDIGDAAVKNDWDQDLPTRVKQTPQRQRFTLVS